MLSDVQLHALRADFPVLSQVVNQHPLVYLDNAATTQKPKVVLEAINTYYRDTNANVHRASHALSARATVAFEAARKTAQQFINAAYTHELIWTRGATESINLVANSLGHDFQPGDEIILSTLEHHANIVPWQMLAQRSGAVIKVIPLLANGDLDLTAYQALLNERTRLVAITQVSNAIGTVNPIHAMIRQAHDAGALVLIDGAQAMSHWPVDVQQLDCDFYVFSGHKMFGPTGIGMLYGKEALLEQMPPWQGGGEMIRQVSFSGTSYNQLPFKFEAGTPNIAGAISLAAAMTFLQAQDRDALQAHEASLLQKADDLLSDLPGVTLIGRPAQRAGAISFVLDDAHNADVGTLLDMQGIAVRTGHHCAQPLMDALGVPGTIRASFSIYNSMDEVCFFAEALKKVHQFL